MTLAELVARVGLAEVARRVGVRPDTVTRWLRTSVSSRYTKTIAGIIARHLASRRGVETRQKRAKFRAALPMPPEPYREKYRPTLGNLTPDQVLPRKPPIETEAQLQAARIRGGHEGDNTIDTDLYFGESTWMPVGAPVLEVDFAGLADQVIAFWQASARNWCRVIFMFFRYIPFNPLYRGELAAKAGKWFDWWSSTHVNGSLQSIYSDMENVWTDARDAAYQRMIWLEAIKVSVFDNKGDLPGYTDMMGRQLR